jgi:hypothetical protein
MTSTAHPGIFGKINGLIVILIHRVEDVFEPFSVTSSFFAGSPGHWRVARELAKADRLIPIAVHFFE